MTIYPLGKKSRIRATHESKGPSHKKVRKEVERDAEKLPGGDRGVDPDPPDGRGGPLLLNHRGGLAGGAGPPDDRTNGAGIRAGRRTGKLYRISRREQVKIPSEGRDAGGPLQKVRPRARRGGRESYSAYLWNTKPDSFAPLWWHSKQFLTGSIFIGFPAGSNAWKTQPPVDSAFRSLIMTIDLTFGPGA